MNCNFIQRAHPGVRELHPYQAGKPIDELARELGLTHITKLASNENPLGCSPRVTNTIQQVMTQIARYPDANGFSLKQALCQRYGCSVEQLILGNGSNEVLELVLRTFVTSHDEVIYSEHAFIVYALITQAIGAKPIVTPAREWGHDLEMMLASITPRTKVICIANPNNPTGTLLTPQTLLEFLRRVPSNVLVLLDEAYSEYLSESQRSDSIRWLNKFSNLIVCRTFSKAYGLAGLRVGYGICSAEIADLANRVREPFNCNVFALAAATTALADEAFIEQTVALNQDQMHKLQNYFQKCDITYIPSAANFITIDLQCDATPIYQRLLQLGVIVRPIAGYGMPTHLRVSIGTEDENKHFMDAFSQILNEFFI